MRVLILGEDAPGGLMASYARGFAEIGVDVRTFCLARAYASAVPSLRWRAVRRVAEPLLLAAFNSSVERELSAVDADLVVVLKGHRLNMSTIGALRESVGAPVVNFYPDDPFARERSNRLVYGSDVLAAYDACFTFARHLMPAYEEAGARAVHYLPFARDPELHAPPATRPSPKFDVVFVGNLDDDRIAWLDAIARRRSVAVFGERTKAIVPKRSALAKATFGPAAYGPALSQTLALGVISLNVMRPQNASSHNMRSFESPACGAFTLSQRTPELTTLFADGEEIVCVDSIADVPDAVDRWLGDVTAREAVARAGFERVRDDTYARRACTLLELSGVGVEAAI
jgi:spore maturation protein CgeB